MDAQKNQSGMIKTPNMALVFAYFQTVKLFGTFL